MTGACRIPFAPDIGGLAAAAMSRRSPTGVVVVSG
jgi:hypothetical protein